MNRIYRLVFNTSLGLIQVACELGSAKGKGCDRRSSSEKTRKTLPAKNPIAAAIALSLGLMAPLLWTAPAQATATVLGNATGLPGGDGGAATATTPGYGGTGTSAISGYSNAGGVGGTYASAPGGGGFGIDGYGRGGAGGDYVYGGSRNYDGGGGGGGGAPGAFLSGTGSYVIYGATSITGGAGGSGGAGYQTAVGGYGADGGDGLYGNGFTLTNSGTITGGAGGAGGSSGGASGLPGYGGAGVAGSGFTLTNSGTITGGVGTFPYVITSGDTGIYTKGGATIINRSTGVIAGEYSGLSRATAVCFNGGGNTLKLYAGSTLLGDVASFSNNLNGGDTLELSGVTNATLNGTFAYSPPPSYGSAPVFSGFQTLRKTGSSTWTVNTTSTFGYFNSIPDWDVEAGILQLASGDNFSPLAAHDLTIGVAPTSAVTATAGTDNGELVVPGTANLDGETLTVNAAAGTYTFNTQYDLLHAGTLTNAFGSVTVNGSLGGFIPMITYSSTDVYMTIQAPAPGVFGLTNLTTTEGTAATETFTLTGAGPLTVGVASNNTALLPATNISGASTCIAAGSCSLTLTPVSGQSGSATVTLTVADTYSNTTTVNFSVTVTAPSGGGGGSTGGSGGGGAFGFLSLAGLLGLAGVSARKRKRLPSR